MDHQEQHHQHHRKVREEKKRQEQQFERDQEKKPRVIHPLWFLALGILLIAAVVLTWVLWSGAFRAG